MRARSTFLLLLVLATFFPPIVVLTATAGAVKVLPILVVALTWLITLSLSHVPATVHLIASDPNTRAYLASQSLWRVLPPLAFIVAAPISLMFATEAGASFLVLAFLVYQAWHFGRQNMGVLAFAALAAGSAPLSHMERRAVGAATVAGMLGVTNPAVFSVLGFGPEPLLASIPPLRQFFSSVHAIGFALYLTLITSVLLLGIRQRPPRTLAETLLYLGSVIFFLPLYLSEASLVAYWSYATAHGVQYLLFLAYHATGWSYGVGRRPTYRWPRGMLGLCSLLIFIVSVVALLRIQQALPGPITATIDSVTHWMGSEALSDRAMRRGGIGVILGITLGHFWVDQNIWRLRDGSRREWIRDRYAFLFSSKASSGA